MQLDAFLSGIDILRCWQVPAIVDAIVGLPGDDLASFRKTAAFIGSHGLPARYFSLSLGRAAPLRRKASAFGLQFTSEPPYYVYKTPAFSREDMEQAVGEIAAASADCELIEDLQLTSPPLAVGTPREQ